MGGAVDRPLGERLVVVLTAEELGCTLEVRDGSELPITVHMSWDERLQVLGAIGAGLGAFAAALRQKRR